MQRQHTDTDDGPVIAYASPRSAAKHRPPRARVYTLIVAAVVLYWSLTTSSHLIFSSGVPVLTTNTADLVRDMVRDTPAKNWDLGAYTVSSFVGFHVVDSAAYGRRFVMVPEWVVVLVLGTAVLLTFWLTRRSAAA